MRIFPTEFFFLTVLFRSIESSPPARALSASSPPRERSRSPSSSYRDPPIKLPSAHGRICSLEELKFIRLIPARNLKKQFELRKYTFPADKQIKLREGHQIFKPMPPHEQIVLTTSDGDVFAILSSSDSLAGIYRYVLHFKSTKRIKINIESGCITPLNTDEVEEVPVGLTHRIQYNFRVEHLNHSDGSHSSAEPDIPANSRSHPAFPFSNVLGYRLDQLKFIRLCNYENPHRLFELRKYTFPVDKPIKVLSEQNRYRPIAIQEQIVLSTYGGNVFAIFQSSDILSGIYAHDPRTQKEKRAKINMGSGRIDLLTSDEIREVPVGPRREVRLYFIVDLIKQTSLHQ